MYTMRHLASVLFHFSLCIGLVACIGADDDDPVSVIASFPPIVSPAGGSGRGTSATEAGDGKPADDQSVDIRHMSASGIVSARGYEAQVHYAITRDGYYIHVVRIINPLLGKQAPPKRPVVFNHGLLESALIWLINSNGVRPENKASRCESLPINLEVAKNQTEYLNGPMLLANHGYDVWLMSMRGTDFSMYHKKWDTSSAAYWDYSLDNFALDDVPAVINYVRRYTGHKKVAYVGHSQATFSVFGLLAAKPHYADIIEPVFAVAPVAYMYHLTSLAKPSFLKELDTPDVHGPVPEKARQIRTRFGQYCNKDTQLPVKLVCDAMDSILGGKGKGSLNDYLSFFPYHTSHKVLRHFAQIITKKIFGMYDHGPEENLKRYGRREAPLYKAANIRSKSINLFWTKTDSLSDPRDVDRFKSELKVAIYKDTYIDREFNHFDLITHQDARYLVFAPILEVLEEFERRDGVCKPEEQSVVKQLGDKLVDSGSAAYQSVFSDLANTDNNNNNNNLGEAS